VTKTTPISLTIAGSDSGGGAGIQADIKAMSANGVYAASVITAVTAQNTRSVSAVHEIPAPIVAAQIDAVLSDLSVQSIKLGVLFSPQIIQAVASALSAFRGAVVVDPVMIAKSGDALLQEDAVAALIADILPRADLLTPNLPEAARLLNQPEADSADKMVTQARALLKMGPKAVLMKGGHSAGNICSDALVTAERVTWLSAPRIDTRNTHGTGCTYAAAIAAGLAHGNPLGAAVQAAHDYLHRAIIAADQLEIGTGHGPVHHFHAVWS